MGGLIMQDFLLLSFIIFVIWFIAFLYEKQKGTLGERKVANILSMLPSEYKVINDILIKNGNISAQIDHVVVSPYGVFVIETKNYTGDITGDERAKYWLQYIGRHTINEVYNPIWQNNKHIKTLRYTLSDFPNIKYHSIIVFTPRATLKHINAKTPVIYSHELLKYIKTFNTPVLSEEQVLNIYNTLMQAHITDKHARKEHIRYVREVKKRE